MREEKSAGGRDEGEGSLWLGPKSGREFVGAAGAAEEEDEGTGAARAGRTRTAGTVPSTPPVEERASPLGRESRRS